MPVKHSASEKKWLYIPTILHYSYFQILGISVGTYLCFIIVAMSNNALTMLMLCHYIASTFISAVCLSVKMQIGAAFPFIFQLVWTPQFYNQLCCYLGVCL